MGSADPQVQVAPRFEWRPLTRARMNADSLLVLVPSFRVRSPKISPPVVEPDISHFDRAWNLYGSLAKPGLLLVPF